ncbi:MAG: thiamine pyrophosphate-binding protein [Clostridia bacterium]|nr:thiamine pyrophosphate-binding protein [Clostridia bacterium]
MAKLNGGQLIQRVFEKEGVKYIFGLPGGHIYPMIEACNDVGIKFISCRHEMDAAFMAEGWALTTGEVGVCTGTAGPGTTNLVTGVANAACNQVPLLCVGGKARVSEYERNELQDFDTMALFRDMCKHTKQIPDGMRIAEYFGRGIAEAMNDQPGPVYLEVPRDKMEAQDYDEDKVDFQNTWRHTGKSAGNAADIAKAVELINAAERPILIAGSGAFWSGAAAELTQFIEKIDCPIFTRNAGRGIVPDTHPLAMCIGSSKHPLCAAAIQGSDLIIILGTRTGYTLPKNSFPKGAPILRIDIDAAGISDQLDIKAGIVGDAKEVLKQLIPAVKEAKHTEWVAELKGSLQMMMGFMGQSFTSDQVPIHPLRLCADLRKFIDKDTVLVIDGGDTASWGNMTLPAMGPGQLLTIANGSFGPLGVGVPYAIAAKLAHPEKKVILLVGDGAFGYGALEYDTCLKYGINITTVILNDSCWGMIKNSEAKKAAPGKEFVGLNLRQSVRYDKVIEALGGYGEYVTEPKDIVPAIQRALAQDKPSVVNVITDTKIAFAF